MSDETRLADQTRNFGANLRFLCEQHGSISQICRKIRINRQQFNKYLSGLHLPSSQNQRLIANHFGLSPSIFFIDNDEFVTLLEGNYFHAIEEVRKQPKFNMFLQTALLADKPADSQLIGVYDRYQYSSIYKGKILRSAFCIYRNGDFLQHYYVERFPSFERPSKADYIFKYHGFVIPLGGRIFTLDFEAVRKCEMTFGICAPVQRSAKNFMFGITSGIAETVLRPPYSTKVAMHYLGPGMMRKQHLQRLTALGRHDRSIPAEVLQFLDSDEMSPR